MNGYKYPRQFALLSKNGNWSYLKVEGGWILHHYTHHLKGSETAISECSVFLPDVNGLWASQLEPEE